MNCWQLCQEIRRTLRSAEWPSSTNPVFGSGSVIVSVSPEEEVADLIRFPAVLVQPLDLEVDPEHRQQPDYIRQRIGIQVINQVDGDPYGENVLIGGHWPTAADTTDGKGILEIEEEIFNAIELLSEDNGIVIQLVAASGTTPVRISNESTGVLRDYVFEAWLTASRFYPPPTEMAGSVGGSNVTLSWRNPAISRYDFHRMMLRRAAGSVAPTRTGGVELALSSSVATSHVDTPGAGTFSYAIFAVYDDRNNTPSQDIEVSESDTVEALVVT